MFLSKIRRRESGILIYGITPPKIHTPLEKVQAIATKTVNTLSSFDIDALVVYDVQDESARTPEERPFPFINAQDPFEYASQHLQGLNIPKIIYRPAGKFTKAELDQWLNGLATNRFHPVFVGLPSPDHVVVTSLPEAYRIWKESHEERTVMGAVMIPERHAILKDEQKRIIDKVNSGVSYFISQCIFNVEYTKQVLDDLVVECTASGRSIPSMIFTLTICGSQRTLEFMEWLGIYFPEAIREELKVCSNPVAYSVELATGIAKDLVVYCQERGIPFGFNIESVATRKEEVEASLELLNTVRNLLQEAGVRKIMHVQQQVIG